MAPALERPRDTVMGYQPGTGEAPDGDAGREYRDRDRGGGRGHGGEDWRVGGDVVAAVGDDEPGYAGQPAGRRRGRTLAATMGADGGPELIYAEAQRDEAEQP